MEVLGYFLLVTLAGAIIAGTVEHNRNLSNIRKMAKAMKPFNIKFIMASIIWISVVAIMLFAVFDKTSQFDKNVLSFIIFIVSTLSFILTIIEYKISSLVKRNKSLAIVLFGGVVFIVTLITSVYVDAEISLLTSLNASLFPNSQKFILLLLAPVFWIYLTLFISAIMYFSHAAVMLTSMLRESTYINGVYGAICIIAGLKRSKQKFDYYYDAAILIGLLVFVTVMPGSFSYILNGEYYLKKIPELLVFSSYHSAKSSCENIKDEAVQIAFLKGDSISIAVKDDKGNYSFFVEKCKIPASRRLSKGTSESGVGG